MGKNFLTPYEEKTLKNIINYKLRGRKFWNLPPTLKELWLNLNLTKYGEMNEHD